VTGSITAQAPTSAPLPVPRPANIGGPTRLAAVKQQSPSREPSREASREPSRDQSHAPGDEPNHGSRPQPEYAAAFLESLTSAVDSGNLFAQRQLTAADMMDYANRNYRNARTAELLPTDPEYK